MGGIFGKNKRLRVFPKRAVLYKAKRKEPLGTVRMFCDAATWTGENHVHSARVGRTPQGPEASAAKLELAVPESQSAAQAPWETEPAAPPGAQRSEAPLSVTARDAQDAEVSQDPEAKPSAGVMQHQELAEGTKEAAQAARRSPKESRKAEAVLHPAGGCVSDERLGREDREVAPLTQSMVTAEVHVSADVQGGPGKVQPVPAEAELLPGAEQEAGAVSASEEPCAGKTHRAEPVQKAAASPAALGPTEESELPLKAMETREDITDVERSAEEQEVEEELPCAAEAPPDLQLEQDTEVPVTEDVEGNAVEPEQAEEMAEVCADGQTSQEPPSCLAETQGEENNNTASNGGETRGALKEHMESGAAAMEQSEGLSAAK